jgi:hypothetical protein
MPAIENVKLFLEVADALHYSQDKLMLVLNRADSTEESRSRTSRKA